MQKYGYRAVYGPISPSEEDYSGLLSHYRFIKLPSVIFINQGKTNKMVDRNNKSANLPPADICIEGPGNLI